MPSIEVAAVGKPPTASSYGQILKSSAVIGGASLLNVLVGILRTKAMAMMLGPVGIGLLALYNAISDVARSIAEMGVNGSGVRQIANAVGTGDAVQLARTVTVLRRVAVMLGALGAGLLLAFAGPIGVLTFDNNTHTGAVAFISVAVMLRLIGDGQSALMQGMRRIGDIARINVLGGLLGTVATIAIIHELGERGLVLSIVVAAGMTLIVSWWYSRQIDVQRMRMSFGEMRQETAALLKLGVAFMASGLLMQAASYAVRIIVMREAGGPAAAGLYQAAWAVGGLYVAFVLQAMGTDFYPRLVSAIHDHADGNRLVNEQTHVSLLLAGPGVIATLTLAPLVVAVLYSPAFADAVDLLRWICAGMAIRVITWPMGFIVVAKGRQTVFFITELAWTVTNIALSLAFVRAFGLNGAGMAFLVSNLLHGLMIYPIVRRLSGFRLSPEAWKSCGYFAAPLCIAFYGFHALPWVLATGLGVLMTVATSVHAIHGLIHLLAPDRLPLRLQRLLQTGKLRHERH